MKYIVFILLSFIMTQKIQPQSINFTISEKNQIIIDYNSEFYEFYINNTDKISIADKISIKNIPDTTNSIPSLNKIKTLNILKFSNTDPNNLYRIIHNISNNANINKLVFNELKSYRQNNNIRLKFNKIEFNYCTSEAVKAVLNAIENKNEIISIKINNSNLIEIAEEISKFKNLKYLDLTANFLQNISNQIENTSNIDSLKISGNNIPNFNNELLEMDLSELTYLEIDKIDNESLTALKEKFPNIEIKQILSKNEEEKSELLYGELKTSIGKVKAFSTAYIHYPEVMNNIMASTTIDSTPFEERFYNLDYLGVYSKYDRNLISKNRLFLHNNFIDDKISFNFIAKRTWFNKNRKMDFSFYKSYPEFGAFKQCTWVMDTVLSKKEAKKFFKTFRFNDVRLFYNSSENNFTLILKDKDGLHKFKVYPISSKSSIQIEEQRKNYPELYASYLKRLSSRGRKFNQDIIRSKTRLYSARKLFKETLWANFRSNYMSETEKQMSKTEWLKYYYDIIENEQEALSEADLRSDLLFRNLELIGYLESSFIELDYTEYNAFLIQLTDKMNNNIPVNTLLVINKSDLSFQIIQHRNPLNEIPIIIKAEDSYVLIAFLHNNSVATVKSEILNNSLKGDKVSRIESFILPQEFYTCGQITNDLEL